MLYDIADHYAFVIWTMLHLWKSNHTCLSYDTFIQPCLSICCYWYSNVGSIKCEMYSSKYNHLSIQEIQLMQTCKAAASPTPSFSRESSFTAESSINISQVCTVADNPSMILLETSVCVSVCVCVCVCVSVCVCVCLIISKVFLYQTC